MVRPFAEVKCIKLGHVRYTNGAREVDLLTSICMKLAWSKKAISQYHGRIALLLCTCMVLALMKLNSVGHVNYRRLYTLGLQPGLHEHRG